MKRQARAKGSESVSKMPEPGRENTEAVPQSLYIYEEIKDTRPHTGCKTSQLPTNPSDSTKTVYATAQLPTNPSDYINTVYSTPQLPTTPSDYITTVYSTPQLPTTPSDYITTAYSTLQLPTTPSDSITTVHSTPQLPTNPSDFEHHMLIIVLWFNYGRIDKKQPQTQCCHPPNERFEGPSPGRQDWTEVLRIFHRVTEYWGQYRVYHISYCRGHN
ncbi:hepatitis A virus cellular receptor 1-like [Carassius carassius]|uniref:hepatitis A virus cellular receptor 1-like n=1 Tax=Carassius carassius TaxID=217509 RepID=UPI002868B29D|nr:hepatitis A virus cellular receptor 1-like [Carassius carassius]